MKPDVLKVDVQYDTDSGLLTVTNHAAQIRMEVPITVGVLLAGKKVEVDAEFNDVHPKAGTAARVDDLQKRAR